MKRLFLSSAGCLFLISFIAWMFNGPVDAFVEKGDPIMELLDLPAPPPPNDLVDTTAFTRDPSFYDRTKPPPDNAPIEDLLDYWAEIGRNHRPSGYNPYPSETALARMLPEIEGQPDRVFEYLNVIDRSDRGAAMVKRLYDQWPESDEDDENNSGEKQRLKNWLTQNSPYFAEDLAKEARQKGDVSGYVENQEAFHNLTKVDWERALPIVNNMYADSSQPASQVMARWALYRQAIKTGSLDVERYRDELKAAVEDRSLTDAIRDLSLDALLMEKEWAGRDEWYFSLMSDETLVAVKPYTGLTTLMIHSPSDKYIDKMIEFSRSENKVVRTAAVRNLEISIGSGEPKVVKALLPWVSDANWVNKEATGRYNVIRALSEVKLPDSVPGLIALLDESELRPKEDYGDYYSSANTAANAAANAANTAARTIANAANTAGNAISGKKAAEDMVTVYPLRGVAISALANQADKRAVPALRRILNQVDPYLQRSVIAALVASDGFTIFEQADAVEFMVREAEENKLLLMEGNSANAAANMPRYSMGSGYVSPQKNDPNLITRLIGFSVLEKGEIADGLIRELVKRIESYDKSDPSMAALMRQVFVNWNGKAINAVLLNDLKNGRSNVSSLVKLLSIRKELREKQQEDVYAIRTGVPTAFGISSCLLESNQDYNSILAEKNSDAKLAMLACARLIRARLPLQEVAKELSSDNKSIALAAERYLESEDSPEARSIVLSVNPNSAKILGATTAFWVKDRDVITPNYLNLIGSVSPVFTRQYSYALYSGLSDLYANEANLRKEVIESSDLLGIYIYGKNVIKIYKDKTVYNWIEDDSRFYERELLKEEFTDLTDYLSQYKAEDLPPFLGCRNYGCSSKHLVMFGKAGGRRVFSFTDRVPKFFVGLDAIFSNFKGTRGRLRYSLEKDIPGLEILYAKEGSEVETVWKKGTDFRVLIKDAKLMQSISESVERQIAEIWELEDETEDSTLLDERISKIRSEREYDPYNWYELSGHDLGSISVQPPGIDFIPHKDNVEIEADSNSWMARTTDIEVRASSKGLYLIKNGRATMVKDGFYSSPVVTPDGKWAVVTKFSDEGIVLVRVNLVTKKEFPVSKGEDDLSSAISYVSSINRVLVSDISYYGHGDYRASINEDNSYWLNVETGALQPAKGNLIPLGQQTFRPLQSTNKVNEFWAAIPDQSNSLTKIGVYDTKNFTFRAVRSIPKIVFSSMDMWVDADENKIYFVYNGHLLALPLEPVSPGSK